MRRLPTMLFYDWKDPLLEGCGEDAPYHRHPRPCHRRRRAAEWRMPSDCRGGAARAELGEARLLSLAPAGGAQRAALPAGAVLSQCGYPTTPSSPSVRSTRSALSCGCSPGGPETSCSGGGEAEPDFCLQLRKSKVIHSRNIYCIYTVSLPLFFLNA